MMAGPMFLAIMAIGPLADFVANVVQKLTYLTLLNMEYPLKVEMFLTLSSGLGNTGGAAGEQIDDTNTSEYLNEQDRAYNLTIADQRAPRKFEAKKMNPIFLKTGWPMMQKLIIIYFLTVFWHILNRRYKHFNNGGNEYAVESEKATEIRLVKYTFFKGLKQKWTWKNFIRGFVTGFQPIMFSIMLQMKQSS